MKKMGSILNVLLLGGFWGFVIGFVLLSFGELIGKSGYSDQQGLGHWNPLLSAEEAIAYGLPFGIVFSVACYFLYLKNRELTSKLVVKLVTYTLVAGLIGAVVGPPLAAFLGIAAFIFACRSSKTLSKK
jgi:uncharacterized membrane protein YfcA